MVESQGCNGGTTSPTVHRSPFTVHRAQGRSGRYHPTMKRRSNPSKPLLVTSILALVLAMVAPWSTIASGQAAPPPPEPGLLPVPEPLPAAAPGTLIDSVEFPSGDFGFDVEAHQILFHSTDRHGADIAVSGIVLVPTGIPAPAGGRGVAAWGHGTTGLHDRCAPSLEAQEGWRLNNPGSYERVDDLLAAGHVVVASDYPGLGTPGVHPYLDGEGEGRSVLDSVRAAREFGGTGPVVIQGFSQGSQAALFAGQLASEYAPEIDLRAVVAIGTPSLFGEAFAAMDIPVVQGYITKVLGGILATYPELPRDQILTPSGEAAWDDYVAKADDLYYHCFDPQFWVPNDVKADPMTVPAWRDAILALYPGKSPIDVPVLMVQSTDDEQALAMLADGVCRDLQANGSDVRMWRYDGPGHVASVHESATDRMQWINDRLAGRPFTDDVDFEGDLVPRVLTTCPAEGEAPPPPVGAGATPGTPATPVLPTSPGGPATPGVPAAPATPMGGTANYTG